jgi:NTP pyrophosphatase (non-canonical NTP hydrolase)
MTEDPKFTNEVGGGIDEEVEKINNAAQERSEQERQRVEDVADATPKSIDDALNDPNVKGAAKTRKRVVEKKKEQESAEKGPKKFEIDLDRYTEFVDNVTSDASKNFDDLIARYAELNAAGCKIQRLDTAASGLVAEGGEFMEIVKKLKFQGKPWDEANKEHLTKELGDIMWYVAQAALALDVRLDEVIYINTLKLAARYPDGIFDVHYSENRCPGDI